MPIYFQISFRVMLLLLASFAICLSSTVNALAQEDDEDDNIGPPPAEYKIFDGLNVSTLNTELDSLLFPQNDLDRFHEQLSSYKKSGGGLAKSLELYEEKVEEEDDGIDKVQDQLITSPSSELVSPSFFLKSILYTDAKNWTIWLNGDKVRSEYSDEYPKAEILKVTPEYVVLKWKSSDFDRLSPNYASELKEVIKGDMEVGKRSEWNLASEKKDIHVNSIKGEVKFKLYPSQSFSVYYMRIYEGQVGNVVIDETGQTVTTTEGPGIGTLQDINATAEKVKAIDL